MKLYKYVTATAAAAILFSGCESATNERLFAPSADVQVASTDANNTSVTKTKTLKLGNKGTALITELGGVLYVNGHTLKVPAGAVKQATWFSMQVVEANAVHVKLRAWRALDGAAVTQFPSVPVQLILDARDVDSLDPTGLVVVYLRDGTYAGAKEKVATSVNTSNWTVTGTLTHFSDYALAREYSMGVD
jgi:hypothetical protein